MRFRNVLAEWKDEGELVASFGQARLVKYLDGKVQLKGGAEEDRVAAKEWISLFFCGLDDCAEVGFTLTHLLQFEKLTC